jgi:antagonist of KipI
LFTTLQASAGQTLRLGHSRSGARCYFSVRGGVSVPAFLGSASTHLLSGLGGFSGRALRKGDTLAVGPEPSGPTFNPRRIAPNTIAMLEPRKIIRVTAGTQAGWFPESSQHLFYGTNYQVTEHSNRMGIRLTGPAIHSATDKQMITEGLPLGAIQIPPDGQPILIFVEQQTTGGYPKIANVICADLHSVGQLRPRDEIRFERVTLETARTLLQEQERWLDAVLPRQT